MDASTMSKNDNGEHDGWWFPLLLSSLAGASTCVGAGIVFCFSPETIQRSMPFSLALAGSVMITVSVISIGPECLQEIEGIDSKSMHILAERLLFFGLGCLGYYLLSKCAFPEPEAIVSESLLFQKNHSPIKEKQETVETIQDSPSPSKHGPPTRMRRTNINTNLNSNNSTMSDWQVSSTTSSSSWDDSYLEDDDDEEAQEEAFSLTKSKFKTKTKSNKNSPSKQSYSNKRTWTSWSTGSDLPTAEAKRSWRVALLLFVSLLCHNFPEGLAVVASTVESRELGMTVAIGILIHNIPEGIAIAVPCLAARPDSPWLAFWLASASGLAEPCGAWMALMVLRNGTTLHIGNVLACVAGIMCMVAAMELYPEAFRHVQQAHGTESIVAGTLCGILVMVATEYVI
jgi:ZIP family zinc transporter